MEVAREWIKKEDEKRMNPWYIVVVQKTMDTDTDGAGNTMVTSILPHLIREMDDIISALSFADTYYILTLSCYPVSLTR